MDRSSPLTARFVKTVTRPGRYGDKRGGHGLSLLVKPARKGGHSKSWCQRLRYRRVTLDLGLGAYPGVSLKQARDKALANAQAVAQGKDPRVPDTVPTFAEAAAAVIALRRPSWKPGGSTEAQWKSTFKNHVFPQLVAVPVDEISAADVRAVLKPLRERLRNTADKLRHRIRRVLGWCQAHGYVEENVADNRLNAALSPKPSNKDHYRSLPYGDLPAALAAAQATGGQLATRLCFRFLILTAARSEEARGALWSEMLMDKREWFIPEGPRMKNGVEHRQPLSGPALAVLEEARALDDGSGYVFPSSKGSGKPMNGKTLTELLDKIGIRDEATVHGFRSTFRVWASECTDADHAVMQLSIAHVVGDKVVQAYDGADLLQKRRDLMEQWGAYACGSAECDPARCSSPKRRKREKRGTKSNEVRRVTRSRVMR